MIGGVDDEVYKTFNPFRLGMVLGRMDLSGGYRAISVRLFKASLDSFDH